MRINCNTYIICTCKTYAGKKFVHNGERRRWYKDGSEDGEKSNFRCAGTLELRLLYIFFKL
jgi:hypothetical protein